MAASFHTPLPLPLGISSEPQAGYGSPLFLLGLGSISPVAPTQAGFRSLLGFWAGGAGLYVPPVEPPEPEPSHGGGQPGTVVGFSSFDRFHLEQALRPHVEDEEELCEIVAVLSAILCRL